VSEDVKKKPSLKSSSQLKHGLAIGFMFYPTEDPAEIDEFLVDVAEEFAPEGRLETTIVFEIAGLLWRVNHVGIFSDARVAVTKHKKAIEGHTLNEARFADEILAFNAAMDGFERAKVRESLGTVPISKDTEYRQKIERLVGKEESDKYFAKIEEAELATPDAAALREKWKARRALNPEEGNAETRRKNEISDSIELAHCASLINPDDYLDGLRYVDELYNMIDRRLRQLWQLKDNKRKSKGRTNRRSCLFPRTDGRNAKPSKQRR
jgi:hypothetical protein